MNRVMKGEQYLFNKLIFFVYFDYSKERFRIWEEFELRHEGDHASVVDDLTSLFGPFFHFHPDHNLGIFYLITRLFFPSCLIVICLLMY